MENLKPTPRTTLKRRPNRGSHDRVVINEILDEGLVCHLGFVAEGQPVVLPTTYVRQGDKVYFHGSAAGRLAEILETGVPACLTMTLLDGLVLARSAMHHSMNYRSVVIFGSAKKVVDEGEKLAALDALIDHIVPGRSRHVRPPSARELKVTTVLSMPIEEASAKIRTGPPVDDESDLALPYWAGVIPVSLVAGPPQPAAELNGSMALPQHVSKRSKSGPYSL